MNKILDTKIEEIIDSYLQMADKGFSIPIEQYLLVRKQAISEMGAGLVYKNAPKALEKSTGSSESVPAVNATLRAVKRAENVANAKSMATAIPAAMVPATPNTAPQDDFNILKSIKDAWN